MAAVVAGVTLASSNGGRICLPFKKKNYSKNKFIDLEDDEKTLGEDTYIYFRLKWIILTIKTNFKAHAAYILEFFHIHS